MLDFGRSDFRQRQRSTGSTRDGSLSAGRKEHQAHSSTRFPHVSKNGGKRDVVLRIYRLEYTRRDSLVYG